MDIIIAGAGTVGYSLAKRLSFLHNVIVIDNNLLKLDKFSEEMDILTFSGNVENPNIYQSIGKEVIDLFIAVTDSDEANLLSCMIIDEEIKVKTKIIRLKNDYFLESAVLKKLDISKAFSPDSLSSQKVASLFDFPQANNIKSFSQCLQKLISIRVGDIKESLSQADLHQRDIILVGIERDKVFFIPNLKEEIQKDDLLYLFLRVETLVNISDIIPIDAPLDVQNVVIFGANTLAQKIAKALISKGLHIKIVETNRMRCLEASELLQDKVTIINSRDIFQEEGLKYADVFISASDNDETNIIKCLDAKERGIKRVIAINNDNNYYELMHQLGIIAMRGSKIGAHYEILDQISSNQIISLTHFCGGKGALFMRKIYPNSPLIAHIIKKPKHSESLFFILRENQMLMPKEAIQYLLDDILIAVSQEDEEEAINQWINNL